MIGGSVIAFYDQQGRPMSQEEALPMTVGFPPAYRRVRESFVRDYHVSTIWRGFDHGFSFIEPGEPVIFETMIFGPGNYVRQWRYCTEELAVLGHFTALYGLLVLADIPVSEVRGWLELTGWNRRKALESANG